MIRSIFAFTTFEVIKFRGRKLLFIVAHIKNFGVRTSRRRTTRRRDNSPMGHLADSTTRRRDNLPTGQLADQTGQLADGTTRRRDNSPTGLLAKGTTMRVNKHSENASQTLVSDMHSVYLLHKKSFSLYTAVHSPVRATTLCVCKRGDFFIISKFSRNQ